MADHRLPRRVPFVRNERQKRQFVDGTPREAASKKLKRIVHQIGQQFVYSNLGPGEDIRVLIVEKGTGDSVQCRLETSSLPPPADKHYEALSYYWGDDDPVCSITISTYDPTATRMHMYNIEQKKLMIRPNLHHALKQLRSPDNDITLWVDAICINQANISEKTKQISKMHDIYSKADNICIWLGVGEVDVDSNRRNFNFIRNLLDLGRLDQLVTSLDAAPQWLAFVDLMRNRWFSRRWVVQELALAKETTLHQGKETIQWLDFRDAVALFVTKHDQIKDLVARSRIRPDADPIGDMRALGANTLVEATSNLFRKSDEGDIRERLLSLEILVSTLLAFEAKDPRDTIYAVLSIAKDTPYADPTVSKDLRITPDYDKSLAELCTDFIEYCVEKSNSLDIICRHWAPVTKFEWKEKWKDDMPSWVSLITGSPFGEPEDALQGRSNGDSLVGTPSRQHQKNYNASGGLVPKAQFERCESFEVPHILVDADLGKQRDDLLRDSHGGHTSVSSIVRDTRREPVRQFKGILVAKGIILDRIGSLSPRAPEGMVLQESLQMGGWPTDNDTEKDRIPDSLWRTLVADRGPDGVNAPSWYNRACVNSLNEVTQNGDLSTGALIENLNSPSTMVTFLKRVQQVVWNRKFLRSKEKNLFGLAPTKAEVGDHICILFGCSVPVILRKAEDDSFFTFIGEAYVHGMMDGEAVSKPVPEHPYTNYGTFQIK